MNPFVRIAVILIVWFCIEGADHAVEAINFPWWMSLLMAAFCTFADIITIMIIDAVTE